MVYKAYEIYNMTTEIQRLVGIIKELREACKDALGYVRKSYYDSSTSDDDNFQNEMIEKLENIIQKTEDE